MSKVSRYISKEFDSIIKDSREYRAYELGVAYGYYHLYEYIQSENGVKAAKNSFKVFIERDDKIGEYFRKLIEIDEEPNSKVDDMLDKMEKYQSTEND